MSEKRIIWTNPDGSVSVLVPSPDVDEAVWRKDIPSGVETIETTVDKLPQDRTFRKAWKASKDGCFECPVKAKEVAHEIRRFKRTQEFYPYDFVIGAQIPGAAEAAEAERQRIREKYAVIQNEIDAAKDLATLKRLIS